MCWSLIGLQHKLRKSSDGNPAGCTFIDRIEFQIIDSWVKEVCMSLLGVITDEERQVVRELAKKLAEYANQPEMERRRKLWYAHNDLKTD